MDVDIVVYAVDEPTNVTARVFRNRSVELTRDTVDPPGSRLEITLDRGRADDFGHFTLGLAIAQQHLDQVILRLGVAKPERDFDVRMSVDVGHPVSVTYDTGALGRRNEKGIAQFCDHRIDVRHREETVEPVGHTGFAAGIRLRR